jgi:hypothetical protein
MSKTVTFIIIIAWGVITIVWDVFLALDKIDGNTWSEVIMVWSYKLPFIPILFGVLSAHFFFNRLEFLKMRAFPFWVTVVAILITIAIFQTIAIWINLYPFIPFVFGIIVGIIFWNLRGEKLGIRKK